MIGVAHRVLIGMEMRDRCSCAGEYSRCSGTRSSRAGWRLGSQPERAIDDRCRASCVDWYGNARPLFLRGRVFALLGYEIVEGRLDDGRMHELRRVNYAPARQAVVRGD